MSKIKISTDSTSDIPASFREALNISVLPLTILHEDKEYRDGVDITPTKFWTRTPCCPCPLRFGPRSI